MKKTKVIIPALGLLVLSTAASVTGTVAWFSANTRVSASGLEIKAKSNEAFLLIAGSVSGADDAAKAASIQALNSGKGLMSLQFEMTTGESDVFPAKPKATSEIKTESGAVAQSDVNSGQYFVSTDTAVTTQDTAAVASNWYTAVNKDPTASTNALTPDSFTSLNTTANDPYEFSKYVIKRSVYLTLAVGSVNAHNLTVTPTIALKDGQGQNVTDISAVRALIVTGSNMVTASSSTSDAQSLHTSDVTLTPTSFIQVDIYLYVDGSAAAVYTNHMAALAAATANFQFDVEIGSAA